MAHLRLYRNSNPATAERYPYLLDLQSNAVARLPTRVVAPVARLAQLGYTPITRLMLRLDVLDEECVVVIQELAAVDATLLRDFVVDLDGRRDDAVRALDLLFRGV